MNSKATRVSVDAKNTTSSSSTSSQNGTIHGFIRRVGRNFGFIQINGTDSLFFGANDVDPPLSIADLRFGDPVQCEMGQNYQGPAARHVRKVFAFRHI